MDINKLTLGEIARVEELSGVSISALGEDSTPKAKLLAALAFVTKKREDRTYQWEQALELTMDEVTELLGLNDAPDADPLG